MSMLSAQVDELRKTADKICELEVIEKINVSWSQKVLAPMLRDAADTIWELRNKCADLMDEHLENARIREELRLLQNGYDSMSREHTQTTVELSDALNVADKLRELVRDMLYDAMENVCSKSYWCDEKNWRTCNDKSCGSHLYVEMAQELGVEAPE